MLTFCFILCFLPWWASAYSNIANPECESSRSTNMKLAIANKRNKTGHWVSQVSLRHGINDHDMWDLDADQTIVACEEEETLLIVATVSGKITGVTTKPSPGPDYELIPGLGYYKIHTNIKSWGEAVEVCYSEGAHLLIYNSNDEVKATEHLWTKHPSNLSGWRNSWIHIGFHDMFQERKYVTIFSKPLNETGYFKWHATEAYGGTSQNCGVTTIKGELADEACSERLVFICELEL
ncbi:hemolymph lipopolysaccharide-binding protein-like [Periplaneta americana]